MRVELTTHFDRFAAAGPAGAAVGLGWAAEHVLGVSTDRVPLEEGTLQRSGVATQTGLTAAISYDTVYAARQHQELTWRHDAGRTARYLQESLLDSEREVLDLIAAGARKALRG